MATMQRWTSRIFALVPQSASSQIFLSITLLETIIDSCIVAVLLNSFEDHVFQAVLKRNEDSVLPVYLGLFVLAHVVQLALAIDAIIAKNTIQVLALIIFNTLFLAYSIIQIVEIKNLIALGTLRILVWLIPGMIALTQVTYLSTIYFIYRDFGWQVFKKIGADRAMKTCYAWYQVFLCILKFDVFFFLAFSLQLVLLVLRQDDAERWLTIAALPITTGVLVCGYLSVRKEKPLLYYIFMSGCALGLTYFTYKLVRIYQLRQTDYVLVFKSLTVFAALCFLSLVWTMVASFVCYRNFGRGLRYHLMRHKVKLVEEDDLDHDGTSYKLEHRMSLD